MARKPPSQRAQGFTLIELMIVVAIIATLAAIAYASYANYVTSSRRAAAAACLSEVAQFMERYYTTNQTYVGATLPALTCRGELTQFYTFAVTAGATATTFAVTAAPQGQQSTRDGAKCGTLGLNHTGARSATGTQGAAGCW